MTQRQIAAIMPLSPIQQGLLYHAVADATPGLYTEQAICQLEGALDLDAFRRTWALLIARHDALRAGFVWQGVTRPLQVFYRDVPFDITHADLRAVPAEEIDAWTAARLRDGRRIADAGNLAQPPLLRIAVARTDASRHVVVLSIHHLIHDGWALSILFNEQIAVYDALANGRTPCLSPAGSFADFVCWQATCHAPALAGFWRSALADCAPSLIAASSLDGASTPDADAGDAQPFERVAEWLDEDSMRGLFACGATHGITLNTVATAAWALVSGRHAAREDLMFGVTTAGRPAAYPGVERLVGVAINTLPCRIRLDTAGRTGSWLDTIQRQQLAIVEHEAATLGDIRGWLGLPPRVTLFDSILVCQNALERFDGRVMGAAVIRGVQSTGHPHYPLMCRVTPGAPPLCEMVFDTRRITRAAASERLAQVGDLLRWLPASLDQPLASVRDRLARADDTRRADEHDKLGARLRQTRRRPRGLVPRTTEEMAS